jgi:hypothetical protein
MRYNDWQNQEAQCEICGKRRERRNLWSKAVFKLDHPSGLWEFLGEMVDVCGECSGKRHDGWKIYR